MADGIHLQVDGGEGERQDTGEHRVVVHAQQSDFFRHGDFGAQADMEGDVGGCVAKAGMLVEEAAFA